MFALLFIKALIFTALTLLTVMLGVLLRFFVKEWRAKTLWRAGS